MLFVALLLALTGCGKMKSYLESVNADSTKVEAAEEDSATLEAKLKRAEERLRKFDEERKRRATKRVKEQVKPAEDYRAKVQDEKDQVACLWDAVCRKGLTAPQEARLKKAWGEKFRQRMDEARVGYP